MKVLIQRVSEANVIVEKKEIAAIKKGYLLLVGIEKDDGKSAVEYLAKKNCKFKNF